MRFPSLILASFLTLCLTAIHAAGLPDSGQDKCDNGSNVLAPCSSTNSGDTATYPRQDGRFGRDAKAGAGTLVKVGGGSGGLDYTKVANNGSDLPASAALGANPGDWACTRDNITGLTWEVKTTSGMHSTYHTYTWYNSDGTRNGGNWGVTQVNLSCYDIHRCDTESFTLDVQAAALCGFRDWRVPTRRELLSIINAGAYYPSQDANYFPNTSLAMWEFWSGTSAVADTGKAWWVSLVSGATGFYNKSETRPAILVRGTEF
jgi:hypothetical protein